ncbi:MAG: HNH endonuclease signature motif containing protein [Brevundimonas sp.]
MDETLRVTPQERADFLAHVNVAGPNDCWPWTGPIMARGNRSQANLPYGIVRFRGMRPYAHRLAWMIANDRPIPKGQVMRHSCHNPTCCNPAHLSLGTVADNNADTRKAGRHRYGITYGHRPQVEESEARAMAAAGLPSIAQISREFGRDRRAIKRAFDLYELELPKRIRTYEDWKAIADGPPMRTKEFEDSTGSDMAVIRAAFFRFGLDFAAIHIGPEPDSHWIQMSQSDAETFKQLSRRYHHRPSTIRAHFDRLGLPYPPKSRKNITKPTN